MRRGLYVILLCAMLLSVHLRAQAPTDWTLADAVLLASSLFQNAPEGSEEKVLLRSITDDLERLNVRYGQNADTESKLVQKVGILYYETLSDDIRALQTLPDQDAARLSVLQAVKRDLAAKARYQSPVMAGSQTSIPPIVTLTISVVAAADAHVAPQTISVHLNSCARGGEPPGKTLFTGRPTAPFKMQLPPACFYLWAESGGIELVGSGRRVDVGAGRGLTTNEQFVF